MLLLISSKSMTTMLEPCVCRECMVSREGREEKRAQLDHPLTFLFSLQYFAVFRELTIEDLPHAMDPVSPTMHPALEPTSNQIEPAAN